MRAAFFISMLVIAILSWGFGGLVYFIVLSAGAWLIGVFEAGMAFRPAQNKNGSPVEPNT